MRGLSAIKCDRLRWYIAFNVNVMGALSGCFLLPLPSCFYFLPRPPIMLVLGWAQGRRQSQRFGGHSFDLKKNNNKIATSRIKNFLVNLIFYHLFGSTIQIELLRLGMFLKTTLSSFMFYHSLFSCHIS